MTNIKKKLFLSLILFPLILILTACNSGGGTNSITQPTLYVTVDSEISDPLVEIYDNQELISQKTGNNTKFKLSNGSYTVKIIKNNTIIKNRTVLIDGENETLKISEWKLLWSDEFNNLESNNWSFETGNGQEASIPGWGNNELQYYTDGNNASIENEKLVITAAEEQISDQYGSYNYTSTRMVTKDKFSFKYGKVEVKAKLPEGQGIWPAIWILGSDIDHISWPECGEIDIVELIGNEPDKIHGTVHGPGYSGSGGIGDSYSYQGEKFSEDYHIFAIEWEENEIRWYVDGNKYHTVNKNDIPAGSEWVYDHDFFLILNVAVGGNWPGYPDSTTEFPQKMYVDWVRVYK